MVQPSLARMACRWVREGAHHHHGKPAWQSVSWHDNPVLPLQLPPISYRFMTFRVYWRKPLTPSRCFSGRSRTDSRKQRPVFP